MVAPAWATDLTDIIIDPVTSAGWTALGGGASGLPAAGETDFYVQGTTCMSKAAWTNAIKGFMYTGGGPWTIPTDGVLLGWMLYGPATASLATKANGGLRAVIGSSSTAYYSYYFAGSDDLLFETWIPVGIDANNATPDATTGAPSGTESVFGVVANLPTTAGPTKGNPLGMDALRYGRHTLTYTHGDGAPNYNTFALAEATANSNTNRWGNIELVKGAFFVQGFHSFGSSGTACDFRDSNRVIFIRACAHNLTNDAVSTAYNRFEILNASTNVDWTNIIFQSLGTRARGVFVHTAGTFDALNCQFIDVDTFSLLSTSVMTDCIFRRTNAITAPGSDLRRSQMLTPTVAANASAVVWNVATDPDGKLDDMVFSRGTNAHHAIELGTSSPTTVTLRGMTVTGFSAVDGNNDSVIHVKRTTGTVTINWVGGSGTPSYKTDGATVVLVIDPVTVSFEVLDNETQAAIQNVYVTLWATGTGPYPSDDAVTITQAAGVATVAHTGHGLTTNDVVLITGCVQDDYNGLHTITVTGVNAYTFAVPTGTASPATGTPLASLVFIDALTNGSGVVSATRTFSSDQDVTGFARKGTSSPVYVAAPLVGTIDSAAGLAVTVQLVKDE